MGQPEGPIQASATPGAGESSFRASKDNLVQFINMREKSRGKRERVLLVKETKRKNERRY